jgi:uncharacterized circularly permuted ATP-grasp superfamily protein
MKLIKVQYKDAMTYEEWLIAQKKLSDRVEEFAKVMKDKYKKYEYSNGLIPDSISQTSEYRKDLANLNFAFKNFQQFNKISPKEFSKRQHEERRAWIKSKRPS